MTSTLTGTSTTPADPTTTPDHSRLLGLSTDVLHQILGLLHTETIYNVRRTCKVLDAITFDRFADEHFAHIYCWVYTSDALVRLKDILQNAPRLVERIRRVTLTDDYLEDRKIDDMYLVRDKNEHISAIWYDTAFAYYRYQKDLKETQAVLMHRILLDLQRLPQSITIALDLSNHYVSSELYKRSCLTTFFALITSRTNISSLAVDNETFRHMEDILEHDKAGFMASMSAVHTLKSLICHWPSKYSEDSHSWFTEILRSAKDLQHLEFNISMLFNDEVENPRRCSLQNIPGEVIQAGQYLKLESLTLVHLSISEKDLSRILRECQSTLKHLNLRRVHLNSGDGGWKCIGEIILKAPKLTDLQIQIIYASADVSGWTSYACTAVKDGTPPGITIHGRENAVRASEKLSELGALLFEQFD